MKSLSSLAPAEAESLGQLLRRAIANGQLNLCVASPFAGGMKEAKKHGFSINDRHDGNGVASCKWNVEVAECEGEEPPNWKPYKRHGVSVYIPQDSINVLGGATV